MGYNKKVIHGYERSEGEVGAPTGDDISHSDMQRYPSNPRSVGFVDRVNQNFSAHQHRSITPGITRPGRHHELGETYDYEENKAMIGESEVEKPVYDSSDGPVPKGGRPQARGKADVFVSGESFGGN